MREKRVFAIVLFLLDMAGVIGLTFKSGVIRPTCSADAEVSEGAEKVEWCLISAVE